MCDLKNIDTFFLRDVNLYLKFLYICSMIKGREILGIHKANVFLSKSSVCSITPPLRIASYYQSIACFIFTLQHF